MPNTYPYEDAYLAPHVTKAREDRAAADVALLGALPAAWVQRLTVLRAYVITCQECQQRPDDLFAVKLSSYGKDYRDSIPLAKAAQAAADSEAGTTPLGAGSFFTIGMERS